MHVGVGYSVSIYEDNESHSRWFCHTHWFTHCALLTTLYKPLDHEHNALAKSIVKNLSYLESIATEVFPSDIVITILFFFFMACNLSVYEQ